MAYDAEAQPTLVQILLHARERVSQGWNQGSCSAGLNVCLGKALMIAHETILGTRALGGWLVVKDYAPALGFESDGALARWNDDDGRTLPEVLARVNAAIQRALNER